MPLYEYLCHRCGKTFEIIQKFADDPLASHPGCGGAVERLISPPALQFKGSGWYVNDYGNGGKSSTRSEPENGSAAKPDTKPESKPETKPETKPAPSTSAEK